MTGQRFQVPAPFQNVKAQIEATLRPLVSLKLQEEMGMPWNSKVGGVPFLPQGMEWPTDPQGRPLFFLAQINFAEMPSLPHFPESGVLQFFVGEDLGWLGCHFEIEETPVYDTYRVVFHKAVVTDISVLNTTLPTYDDPENGPFTRPVELSVTGTLAELPISPDDRAFKDALGWVVPSGRWRALSEELEAAYQEACAAVSPGLSQIGGYPTFTQRDPRTPKHPHLLLFQLASDQDLGFSFGDVGIAHFFIHPDDLANDDFSRVSYYWDCY